jgi:hypothetical protein
MAPIKEAQREMLPTIVGVAATCKTAVVVTTPRQSLIAGGRVISGKDPAGCCTSLEIPLHARECRGTSDAKLISKRIG